MRLWRRAAVTSDPDPDTCEHSWRLRDLSVALPGPYVCEVCDGCGSLRIHASSCHPSARPSAQRLLIARRRRSGQLITGFCQR